MHLHAQIYEFSASVGAFEGYVYHKKSRSDVDVDALEAWTKNLVDAYAMLPPDVRIEIQPGLDLTLNRAISSCQAILEGRNIILERLSSMVTQPRECSPDDFQRKKWFQPDE